MKIKGLAFKNSAQFHVRFDNCDDVVVDSVTINAPASSPNTDGIHIENTHNVQIRNSVISNGIFSSFFFLAIVSVSFINSNQFSFNLAIQRR